MIFKNISIVILLLIGNKISAQNQFASGMLEVDSIKVLFKDATSFPFWLKAGQTIKPSDNVSIISVLEFNADSVNSILLFSRVLTLKSLSTVPTGKTWKIEAIGYSASSGVGTKANIFASPAKYSTAGSYEWIVPPGVNQICIEVWGGGGSGAKTATGFGAGAGGGYGYQCFSVVSGTKYTVVVGGSGGTSSVGSLISATGGSNGSTSGNVSGGASTAQISISGSSSNGLIGGAGANCCDGAASCNCVNSYSICGSPGVSWGGGGNAASTSCGNPTTAGASGRVVIHW